jgi:ABC-type transport system involved in multi-copper enzyme maturation permease subunit
MPLFLEYLLCYAIGLEDAPVLPGPIFNMELLTSARRTRYFFIRAIYAAILLVALGLVYQSFTWSFNQESTNIRIMAMISAAFFGVLSVVQLLAVVVLGPAMVAGTIATERERRTIEYLFASSLSNAEIVLGKLAARMLHLVYLVLAGVPILALMMLLGGIAPEALLVLAVITLCTVLTVSTLSIAVSVWSSRAREAVTRTYLVLFVLLVLPPMTMMVGRTTSYMKFVAPVIEPFVEANPFTILTTIMGSASGANYGAAFGMLFDFARNHLILSLVLAAAATWRVRRVHLKQQGKAARRRWRFSHFFRPSVGNQPMLWKEVFAEPAAARLGWVGHIAMMLIVLAVILLTGYVFWGAMTHGYTYQRINNFYYLEYAMPMGAVLACAGLLLAGARAAGSITSEKERDCWASLLSTPLEPGEIIWAKIAGNLWSLRGLGLLLLLIWGLQALLDPGFLIIVPLMFGMFLLLAFYVIALGVRFSLRCKSSLRAMGATLATALFVGGIYLCCCMPIFIASRAGEETAIVLAPCVPFLIVFPGIAYVESEHFFRGREAAPMLFAYIAGTIGYLIAGIALAGSSIGSFDWITGRTRLRTSMSMLPERPRQSPIGIPREVAMEAIVLPPEEPV